MSSSFLSVNVLSLALAHIRFTFAAFIANAFLLGLAVASIVFLSVTADALDQRARADAKGIDLVVGAKGSPLQLVLAALYHIDVSPGNIPKIQADQLAKNPMIAKAVPINLGDNYRGFRIVGTDTQAFVELYGAQTASGTLALKAMQAVLGSQVAARTGLSMGSHFVGAHGLAEGGPQHKEDIYTVTGILSHTGTVIDRLILTPLESVWLVHEGEVSDVTEREILEAEREYSALLIRYRTPIAAAILPRTINASDKLQAASPAVESARLFSLLEPALLLMKAFAMLLFGASLISIGLATAVSLRERRMDAAVLRLMGASKAKLLRQYALESAMLGSTGAVIGLLISIVALHATAAWLAAGPKIMMPELTLPNTAWQLALLALPVSLLAAAWPALKAARVEVATVLSER